MTNEIGDVLAQMTRTATHLVDSNVELLKRLAATREPAGESSDRGPFQDIWMTSAENAGDLVTLSYLTAQLIDAAVGRQRSTR